MTGKGSCDFGQSQSQTRPTGRWDEGLIGQMTQFEWRSRLRQLRARLSVALSVILHFCPGQRHNSSIIAGVKLRWKNEPL